MVLVSLALALAPEAAQYVPTAATLIAAGLIAEPLVVAVLVPALLVIVPIPAGLSPRPSALSVVHIPAGSVHRQSNAFLIPGHPPAVA